MAFFKKKSVVIEALQWDGTRDSIGVFFPLQKNNVEVYSPFYIIDGELYIETLESDKSNKFHVSKGDWVIKGVKGEFYACKPDIFEQTYERVMRKCEKCNVELQVYFEKPDGDYWVIYARCSECVKIYVYKELREIR